MTATDDMIAKIAKGYRVRFREDFYGATYAVTYPSSRFYPRILLRFRRWVRLAPDEAARIRDTVQRRARQGPPTPDQ